MRRKIIAGNWKMHKTLFEAIDLANSLKRELSETTEVDMVVCPPFCFLGEIHDVLLDTAIELGAQNVHGEDSGAFTGEVSAPMLKSIGVKYVIVGHSERRQFFGETNEVVNKKIKSVLRHGLTPIVCIGENLQEREGSHTFTVLKTQLDGSLRELTKEEFPNIIIAYEPVWAIGTGKTATATQAQEAQAYIRGLLAHRHGEETANEIRIQYGGSVKLDNIAQLLAQKDIDGALVGGASLEAESFVKIVKNSCGVSKEF